MKLKKFRRLAHTKLLKEYLAYEVQRDLNQQCIVRNCSFALGKLREMLLTNEDAVKTTCLFGLQHAIGVLPYHELLTSICDNYRCVYMCLNARMCACVIQRCSYVHKSYNMLLSQVKDFIAIY